MIENNQTHIRLAEFHKRFGEAHLYFAYHTAFPLALTPDLAYRLWSNFQRDTKGQILQSKSGRILQIPWIAVADLLLSNLCQEVAPELYEMEPAIRTELLHRLRQDERFGTPRLLELAQFVETYFAQMLHSNDETLRNFAQAQQWIVTAYIHPDQLAGELAKQLAECVTANDKAGIVHLTSLIETAAGPLEEIGMEPFIIYSHFIEHWVQGKESEATIYRKQLPIETSGLSVAGISLPIPVLSYKKRSDVREVFTIGRDPSCHITIADERVSKKHAEIVFLKNGRVQLIDANSLGGTYLLRGDEFKKITKPTFISPLDIIRLGPHEMAVKDLLEYLRIVQTPSLDESPVPKQGRSERIELARCSNCGFVKRAGDPCPNPKCEENKLEINPLHIELEDLQHQYDLLSENIRSLTEDYHNATMEYEKLDFQRKLDAEKDRRAKVEEQLRTISELLDILDTTNSHLLNQKLTELRHEYDLLSGNIRSLVEDYHNAPMVYEKLPFELKLDAEKARRTKVEQQLRAVSERLDTVNQNKLASENLQQHLQYLEATLLIEEVQIKIRQIHTENLVIEEEIKKTETRITEVETLLQETEHRLRELEGATDFFEQHKEGDLLDGVIQRIHPQHGIFVEVAPNITGLARRDTLAHNFRQLFNEGEKITVELKRLNKHERKVDVLIKSPEVHLNKQ